MWCVHSFALYSAQHACMEELSIFYIIIPSALLVLLSTGAAVLLSYWNHAHGRGGYSLTDMPA